MSTIMVPAECCEDNGKPAASGKGRLPLTNRRVTGWDRDKRVSWMTGNRVAR